MEKSYLGGWSWPEINNPKNTKRNIINIYKKKRQHKIQITDGKWIKAKGWSWPEIPKQHWCCPTLPSSAPPWIVRGLGSNPPTQKWPRVTRWSPSTDNDDINQRQSVTPTMKESCGGSRGWSQMSNEQLVIYDRWGNYGNIYWEWGLTNKITNTNTNTQNYALYFPTSN